MLYQWLHSLADQYSAFNVFRYITFRTFIAFFTGFFFCLWIGPRFIKGLVDRQVGQSIRDDGPQSHKKKAGTPTMGGVAIVGAALVGYLISHIRRGEVFSNQTLVMIDGVMTMTDYLAQTNLLTQSQLMRKTHELQALQAREMWRAKTGD